jgi:hypothetical protein
MTIQFWPNLMGQIVVVLGAHYYITTTKRKNENLSSHFYLVLS